MVNPSKPAPKKVNHRMASISETASDAENRSSSIEYMRSLQAAASEDAIPLPSKTRTKKPLPPRPVLKSHAEARPNGSLPEITNRRSSIDLSSSVTPCNKDEALSSFGEVTDMIPETDGDVILGNHEARILNLILEHGRLTASQIAVWLEFVKQEGSYSKVKKQTTEEYRENSVRKRLAKLAKFGYVVRISRQHGKNSAFWIATPQGRQASTVKGTLQRDLLSPTFDIKRLDIPRHNAMLSSATAAIQVQIGQFSFEKYDRTIRAYKRLTTRGGLNILPANVIYDAAKETQTNDPIALQRAVTESFMINTSPGNNLSGIEPYPQVRGGAIPLTGSHSNADKHTIQEQIRRGVSVIVEGVEYNAVPAAYMYAPLCETPKGVVVPSIVNFAIPMPHHVDGNSMASGSIVVHLDNTASDSMDDRLATLYHLLTFGHHAFVAIGSDTTLYEKVKMDWSNTLCLGIERGLLPESARDRVLFLKYALINSRGAVDFYQPTTDRYAVTPAMG